MSLVHRSSRCSASALAALVFLFCCSAVPSSLALVPAKESASSSSPVDTTTIVKGKVSIPPQFQVAENILANTKLILSNHIETRVAFPNAKGVFAFAGVMAGANYVLELSHPALFFEPITLETTPQTTNEVKVVPYLNDLLYGKGARLR